VLRGSSFAFRKTVFRTRDRRNFGAAFALSSVLVPYCMGAVAGAIASGRVPAGGQAGDPWTSWVNPTSVLGGVLAVVVVAYLAAVYLVWDSRRLADRTMEEYFRRRAIALRFDEAFADLPEIRAPRRLPHRTHTCHIYAIHLDPARLAIDRAEFIELMAKRGIGTSVHFIPLHRHPYYADTYGYNAGQFPIADGLYQGLVSLPAYPRMTGQDVDDVIAAVRDIVIGNRLKTKIKIHSSWMITTCNICIGKMGIHYIKLLVRFGNKI
jgi:hypothetical protein